MKPQILDCWFLWKGENNKTYNTHAELTASPWIFSYPPDCCGCRATNYPESGRKQCLQWEMRCKHWPNVSPPKCLLMIKRKIVPLSWRNWQVALTQVIKDITSDSSADIMWLPISYNEAGPLPLWYSSTNSIALV